MDRPILRTGALACVAATCMLATGCRPTDPQPDTHVCTDPGFMALQKRIAPDDLPTALADLKAQGLTYALMDDNYHGLDGPPAKPGPTILDLHKTLSGNFLRYREELLSFRYGPDNRLTETYCSHLTEGIFGDRS